ncbi:MAG: hypothetical protein QOE28_546 [Solirubrobacteraceae bacterium]|jgi:pSer/pThr/pTyr-binding forkhead associated (FHA) protein|nr:hypothetical protein [Solirubrobacteraceae bacterium]
MPDERPESVAAVAAELQALNRAERTGSPFLVHRDEQGRQRIVELPGGAEKLSIGRRAEADVALTWDSEVSRLHALLEHVGQEWILVDDGLSRNGSFVNGARVLGRRRMADGDRLCFGETVVRFRDPDASRSKSTKAVGGGGAGTPLSPTQRRVLVALCRPLNESAFHAPATNRDIAEEVHLSVDAVKAHLRVLFERFSLEGLPQNQKRARLAATALVRGILSPRDF